MNTNTIYPNRFNNTNVSKPKIVDSQETEFYYIITKLYILNWAFIIVILGPSYQLLMCAVDFFGLADALSIAFINRKNTQEFTVISSYFIVVDRKI